MQSANDRAIAALQATLSLLTPDTTDYVKAQNELNDLTRTQAPKPEAGTPESLTQPPSTQPIIVPPLALPESSGPNTLPQPASPPATPNP